jgi:hypothetical protein
MKRYVYILYDYLECGIEDGFATLDRNDLPGLMHNLGYADRQDMADVLCGLLEKSDSELADGGNWGMGKGWGGATLRVFRV